MKTLLAMTAALTIGAAMPAFAGDMDKPDMQKKAQMWFEKMDSNKDGSVSKSEHDAFGQKMFTEADKDSNGSLSLQEVTEKKMEEKHDMKDKMKDM